MIPTDVIGAKLKRLASNPTPTVLDLFAGCGGFSLGFQSAGYRLLGAVEFDPHAAASHAANFFGGDPLHAAPEDITKLDPLEFVGSLVPGQDPRLAVDVLIGGPPCQAFARIGRAKLREIHDHPEAFRVDDRVRLYESYLRFVRELCPVALVMENVIDILNHAGRNIPDEICEELEGLEGLGYECRYTTLNAVHYGVPQMRERFFLLAIHRRAGVQEPHFPDRTHHWDLPRGYDGARNIAFQALHRTRSRWYVQLEGEGELPAVTAEEALGDLPPIDAHKNGKMRKAPARYAWLEYRATLEEASPYGRVMREWQDFQADPRGVQDHLIRFLPRDYDIFERMKPGEQYPEAWRVAWALFKDRRDSAIVAALVEAGLCHEAALRVLEAWEPDNSRRLMVDEEPIESWRASFDSRRDSLEDWRVDFERRRHSRLFTGNVSAELAAEPAREEAPLRTSSAELRARCLVEENRRKTAIRVARAEKGRQRAVARVLKTWEPGGAECEKLLKATVPGYDPNKFPNKWRKMEPDQPARTLMAHLGKDSYTHIHYDSTEKRTISVREAARLQSFPDGFQFTEALNPSFRQIGNAVPPLLAKAVAEELLDQLVAALPKPRTGPPRKNRARSTRFEACAATSR